MTATDTADVTVIHPAITIAKTPDSQSVQTGGTVNFTIKVTNTGDVTLTNVVVTDALAPGCARTNADLPALASMAPDASVTYDCTLADVTESFTNTATATGTPPVGPDVTDSDTAHVDVTQPPGTPGHLDREEPGHADRRQRWHGDLLDHGHQHRLGDAHERGRHRPAHARLRPDIGTMAPGASTTYTCTAANVACRSRSRSRDREAADRAERDRERHGGRGRAGSGHPGDLDHQEPEVADRRERRHRDLHDHGHEHRRGRPDERHGQRSAVAGLRQGRSAL